MRNSGRGIGVARRFVCLLVVLVALLSNLGQTVPVFAGGQALWTQYGADPAHDGNQLQGPLASNLKGLERRWISHGITGPVSEPVIGEENQAFIAADGALYGLAADSGRRLWKRRVGRVGTPAYFSACGRFSCHEDLFYADTVGLVDLDPSNGRIVWTYRGKKMSWPAVTGTFDTPSAEWVYVTSRSTDVVRLNPRTGKAVWSKRPTMRGRCRLARGESITSVAPAVGGGFVYVAASNGCVYRLAASTGATRWGMQATGASSSPSSVLLSGSGLIVAGGGGSVAGLNARTGRLGWIFRASRTSPGPVGLAAASGDIYATGTRAAGGKASATIYALSRDSGRVLWQRQLGRHPMSSPSLSRGLVYAVGGATLFVLAAPTGRTQRKVSLMGAQADPQGVAVAQPWVYPGNVGISTAGT